MIEANVYQKTVDFPDEWSNGHHVMLDTEELVTVRWDQVEATGDRRPPSLQSNNEPTNQDTKKLYSP